MQKKKFSLTQLIFMALMAAVMCIAGPLAVPIGPVPITLTNLVIYIAVGVLGTAQGTISYCLYLLLGMVGLPVFSGYAGGLGKLAGPTGGYLIGFIAMALIGGIVMEVSHRKLIPTLIGWFIGTAVDYLLGRTDNPTVSGNNISNFDTTINGTQANIIQGAETDLDEIKVALSKLTSSNRHRAIADMLDLLEKYIEK